MTNKEKGELLNGNIRYQAVCEDDGQEFLDSDIFPTKHAARQSFLKHKNLRIVGWLKHDIDFNKSLETDFIGEE